MAADPIDFESFLVEDVILTLGNVRMSLNWLGKASDQPAEAVVGWRRVGFERIDRQLEHLEERARILRETLRDRRAAAGAAATPMFRSRRTLPRRLYAD